MSEPQAGLLLLLLVPVLWGLLWVGWKRRQRRQGGVPAPAAAPGSLGPAQFGPVEATYVSSTSAGDWLDRIAVHGLGVRSAAQVSVLADGVLVARRGAPDVWVGRADLLGVRRERGMAGKFVEAEGLVVLTWQLGEHAVDTGLRVRRDSERDALEEAVRAMLAAQGDGHDTEVQHG